MARHSSDNRNHHDHQSHHQRFLEHTHHHRHVRYHVPRNLDQDSQVKFYRLVGYTIATVILGVFVGYIAYTLVYYANQKPREDLEKHMQQRQLLLAGDNPADAYYSRSTISENTEEAEDTISQEDQDESSQSSTTVSAAGWETYSNERLGFSINHPVQMVIIEGLPGQSSTPGDHILMSNPDTGDKVIIHRQEGFYRPIATSTIFEYDEFELQGFAAIRVIFPGLSSSLKHEIHVLRNDQIWNISGEVLDDTNKRQNLARVTLIVESFRFLDE